jgi:3-hydroxyisobutyrate dehydrogenase-like beta-hydroxyacid dehydrogenase
MTRGGYLTIIGFLIGVIFYQGYSNDRLVDAYKEFSLDSKSDTILIKRVFSGDENFAGNIDNKEKDLSYVKDRNQED